MTDRLIQITNIGTDYKTCISKEILWGEFTKRFIKPKVGKETLEEYLSFPKDKQDKLKNVGGYVGGVFKDDTRKKENLLFRSLITLDLDNIEANTLDSVLDKIDKVIGDSNYLVHSSRKHSIQAPRLRLIIPLDRNVGYEEYEAISRKIGELIGFNLCDKTTFEPQRLMYYPSCSKDADYVFKLNEGELLKADTILDMYDNWQDRSEWKGVADKDIYKNQMAKQEDPLDKKGIIGEFCRAYYPIDEAIDEFLRDVYSPCDIENRYTYVKGSTSAGVVVYKDRFTYSHHNTDPTSGSLCNSFDLVRLHKFSHLDKDVSDLDIKDMPSYKAMVEFANSLDRVKKQRERESYQKAVDDFSTPIAPGVNNATPFLTNTNRIKYSAGKNIDVFIVENDKEASKLEELGFIATYISSEDNPKVWLYEYSVLFKSVNAVIIQNNNDDSKKFVEDTRKKLKYYAFSIKVLSMETNLLDYFEEHSKGDFKELIRYEASKDYAPWVMVTIKRDGTEKISVNEGLMAECVLKSLPIISKPIRDKNRIYLYSKGVYKEIFKTQVKNELELYNPGSLVTDSFLSGVANRVISKSVKDVNLEGKEHIINFKNGLYNVETKELKPHTKKYINLIQLQANFVSNPINKGYFDNYLDYLVRGDEKAKMVVQEFIGLLLSNYHFKKAKAMLIFYGPGNSGKTQIIDIIKRILGEKNTKKISIQEYKERFAFAKADLIRLIYNDELPTGTIDNPSLDILKGITGGGDINCEKKGIDGEDINFRGGLMYSTNKLPALYGDLGDNVFDRMLIIPCGDTIPLDKRDPLLAEKLYEDRNYIVFWALQGLERFIKNNWKFTYCPAIEKVKEEYKLDVDSVRAYVKDRIIITNNKKDIIKPKILYKDYKSWCYDNSYEPLKVNKKIKERFLDIKGISYNPKCNLNGSTAFEGIKIKGDDLYF